MLYEQKVACTLYKGVPLGRQCDVSYLGLLSLARDHFANGKHYLIFLINLQLRSVSIPIGLSCLILLGQFVSYYVQ